MYPIAKNKTTFTKEIFNEGYDRLYGVAYRNATRKFLYILAAILIASVTLILGLRLPLFYLATEGFFIVVMYAYILVILPRNYKKNIYKKLSRGCSDPNPWRSYDFYEDHFVIHFPNETTEECRYEDIESIYNGKNVYLIFTNGKYNALVDKSQFTGELPEIFKNV